MNFYNKLSLTFAIGLSANLHAFAQSIVPEKASTQLQEASTTDSLVARTLIVRAAPDYSTIETDEQIAVVVEAKVAERASIASSALITDTPAAREERHALQRKILAASTAETRELVVYTEIAIETVISEKAAHEAGVTARLSAPTQTNR